MAGFFFWLGAEAEGALSGSRADASSPQAVSTKGFDPARDLIRGFIARNTGWYMSNANVEEIISIARQADQ